MHPIISSSFRNLGILILGLILTLGFDRASVLAATTDTTNMTQVINAAALSIDFVDSSYVSIASPNVPMSTKTFSFASQTSTGTLADDNNSNSGRLYWENPDAADAGYSISLSATGGDTSCWDQASGGSCGSGDYDYNDPGGASDGADSDTFGGQLTVNPAAGTITARTGTTTGMSLGSSTAFSETGSVVSSITLLTASSGADDISSTYVTGIALSQAIPASQSAASYTINMTVTIA